jgi:two-component system, chemotaxis family, chemotaxis protein CheY
MADSRAMVLAADDSATIRSMMKETLQGAGFAVVLAEDGLEALEFAQQNPFALVLTDINMPRMDGLTLVERLRALPDYRFVPILVVTTESEPELKKRGRDAGATGWLVKPFDPLKLVATIRRVLA